MQTGVFYILIINAILLASCQSKTIPKANNSDLVAVYDGFTNKSINEFVSIYSEDIQTNDPDIVAKNEQYESVRNKSFDRVHLGRYHESKGRWVSINLVNSSSLVQDLVLEFKYQRLDGIEGYTFIKDSLVVLGKVERGTPVLARHMPTHDLSLPISIQPSDTLQVFIKSNRYSGFHEYSLELWSKLAYTYKVELSKSIVYIQAGFYLAIVFFTLIVGVLYRRKEILLFSLFVLVYLQLILVFSRYYDGLSYPSGIGLSASSVTGLSVYLTNITFMLFLLVLIHKWVLMNQVLKWVLYGIIFANFIQIIPLFLPQNIYFVIEDSLPHRLSICVILHSFFVLIATFYYFKKTGLYFLMVIEWPLAISLLFLEVSEIFHLEGYDAVRGIYYWATVVSILLMFQFLLIHFRSEIRAKAKLEKDIGQIKISMDRIRNSEIERIGRNLHDGVGNTLASVLGYLSKENKPKIFSLLQQAIDETRMISHNLVKNTEGSLIERISLIIERYNDFSRTYFNFNDLSNGKFEVISVEEKENLFNMIQEICSNTVKHAKAENAFLQIFDRGDRLEINFEDDGIGFNVDDKVEGIGLKNLRKRAEIFKFPLYIDSSKSGTVISIEVKYST